MEEDPKEIIQSVYECIERTCEKLRQLNVNVANIKGALALDGRVADDRGERSALTLPGSRSGGRDQSEGDDLGVGQGDGRAPVQRHR